MAMGNYDDAVDIYRNALSLAKDPDIKAGIYLRIGMYYSTLGYSSKAIVQYKKSLQYLGIGYADFNIATACIQIENGNMPDAVVAMIKALDYTVDVRSRCRLLCFIALLYTILRSLKLAIHYYQRSLSISIETNSRDTEAIAYIGLCKAYNCQQDLDTARQFYIKYHVVSREIDINSPAHSIKDCSSTQQSFVLLS